MDTTKSTTARHVYLSAVISVTKILLIRGYLVPDNYFDLLRTDLSEETKCSNIWQNQNPLYFSDFSNTYTYDKHKKMEEKIKSLPSAVSRLRYSRYINKIKRNKPPKDILVTFIAQNGNSANTDLINKIISEMKKSKDVILVTLDKLTPKAMNTMKLFNEDNSKENKIYHFTYEELMAFPLDTSLCGKYHLYTDKEECESIISLFVKDPKKMPSTFKDDMMSRIYGAVEGNLFVIKRHNLDENSMVDWIQQVRIVSNDERPTEKIRSTSSHD